MDTRGHVLTTKVHDAIRKSRRNGIILYMPAADTTTAIIRLPRITTLAEARTQAENL